MPVALRVPPDVKLIVIDYLRSIDEVDALVDGRVYDVLPADPVFPLLTVKVIPAGSLSAHGWLTHAYLQVNAWDGTEAEGGSPFRARQVAATAEAAMLALWGTWGEGVVSGTESIVGLGEMTDPPTKRPIYMFDVMVHVHPLPVGIGS